MPHPEYARSMMRHALNGLLAMAWFMVTPVWAEGARPFDIEVILFSQLNAYDGGESWLTEPASATQHYEQGGAWRSLPASARNLEGIYQSLRSSQGYRPLAHLHWRQTVTSASQAQPISLQALQPGIRSSTGLDGSIRISVSRYLHLNADLRFQAPGSTTEFRLQESRRMRSGELHYLDHPRFGMLVLIKPVSAEPPQDSEAN